MDAGRDAVGAGFTPFSGDTVTARPVRRHDSTLYLFVRSFVAWTILGSAAVLGGLILYELAR